MNLKLCLLFWISFLLLPFSTRAQSDIDSYNSRVMAAMRVIGHETLLSSGDSTSRVLPINQTENSYKISFESSFAFSTEDVVLSSIRELEQKDLTEHFIIEILTCFDNQIVYSFEFNANDSLSGMPCRTREVLENCHQIRITILDHDGQKEVLANNEPPSKQSQSSYYWFFILLIILAIVGVLFWNRQQKNKPERQLATIGSFHFDERNMVLIKGGETTELTGKEVDLLSLLLSHANTTIERNVILERVWGDDGDYIGRTLDVFISKLRKKLEGDEQVKIINIRGVGYKMILNKP